MTIMDRDYGTSRGKEDALDENRSSETVSDVRPSAKYASHDQAMKVARGVMAKYRDVLRELAK